MSPVRIVGLGLLLGAILVVSRGSARAAELPAGVVTAEFIDDAPPYPECHASTISETKTGFLASWFAGKKEGTNDVSIWVSRHDGKGWLKPVEVADGKQADGTRFPCWNPVLFGTDPVVLFYKVGPSPREWWGMKITSTDNGQTWLRPERLPDGILGPIKNKPVALTDGSWLCPSSTEDKTDGWRVHMERTFDKGRTWVKTDPINDGKTFGIIQPTILTHPNGRLQILCRSRQNKVVESWSADTGMTWDPVAATALPNPNSGIDATNLRDGRFLLVYNHTPKGRSPINVALSRDGRTWQAGPVLETEPGEYSYPAVITARDGLVHITYTWKRKKVKHVVLDADKVELRDIP